MTIFDKLRSLISSKSLLLVEVMVLLIFPVLMVGCAGNSGNTLNLSSSSNQEGIHPLPLDGSSFYYYADGVRIKLTPSLKWISVNFVNDTPAEQSTAIKGSIVNPLEQVRQIPMPKLTLLPLQNGLTTETLIQGINSLRADRTNFLQVNPVFQAGDTEMIMTDEFIVSFPADKERMEIDAINSSHGVEIVEPILGQANTFILRVTEKADLDALSMSNLYQEANVAIYASPNFLRITQY